MFNDEEITKKLKKIKFQPPKEWQHETINRLSVYTDKSSLLSNNKLVLFVKFFYMAMSKKRMLLIAGGSILAGVIILIGGLLLVNQLNFNRAGSLTAEEKLEIFKRIINNNPSAVLSADNREVRAIGESAALAMDMTASATPAPLIFVPAERNYTYRYSKTTYEQGPAAGRCQTMIFDDALHTTENYEFFVSDNESQYKYIQRDRDGDLIGYSLSKNTSTSSEQIEYKGGSYAVRTSYTYDASVRAVDLPADTQPESSINPLETTEPDYTALIHQYFGPDADIVNVVSEDGREYYVVQYTYKTDCSGAAYERVTADVYNPNNLPDTIVVHNYVSTDNFVIQRTLNYLGSADNSNLINTTTVEQETSNVDFSQVSSNFDFEFNVEIRDIVYPNYNSGEEANKLSGYIENERITLLSTSTAKLISAYSNDLSVQEFEKYNYYGDRNFYPAGPKGDAMFEVNNRPYGSEEVLSLLSLSYYLDTVNYDYLTVDIFSQTAVLPNTRQTPTSTSSFSLNIDGQSIPATLYIYETDISPMVLEERAAAVEGGLVANPTDRPLKITVQEVVFDYAGFRYRLTLPQREGFDITTVSFESLNPTNADHMSRIRDMVYEAYTNPRAIPGDGEGSTGSTGVTPSVTP